MSSNLPNRWFTLKPFKTLCELERSTAKYNVIHSGRRAYKTETRKRRMVRLASASLADPRFQSKPFRGLIGAPTIAQVKRVYWEDMKALIPPAWIQDKSEVDLMLRLHGGAEIWLAGLDKPARVEGDEWDYTILDEYADMKPDVLEAHIMPMLTKRMGLMDLVGVPEGRNHYYKKHQDGLDPSKPNWATWGWHSRLVQGQAWVEEAASNMDPLTAQQEFGGEFTSWQGRVYYQFDYKKNVQPCPYDPHGELVLAFDFNLSPGVCAICQEAERGTNVIDEVWIPQNSNTPMVCHKITKAYDKHVGPVSCFGDASGGQGGTARISGSDWDLIREIIGSKWPQAQFRVKKGNPAVVRRINAVNTRLQNMRGDIRLYVDGQKAPHVVTDLDSVARDKNGMPNENDGEIGHISAALGYYIDYRFPISDIIVEPKGRFIIG